MSRCHKLINSSAKSLNSHIKNTGKERSDYSEGQVKHKGHNSHKTGDRRIFSSKYPVYLCTSDMLLALFGLNDCLIADFFNKVKSHVRNGSRTVQSPLTFHLLYNMLQHLFFILVKLQFFKDQLIPLCKLGCCKAYRNPGFLCMVFDQMHNGVKASVNSSSVIIRITKVYFFRLFLIFCHMKSMGYQLVNSLIFCCGNRNYRDSKHFLHPVDNDRTTVFPDLIHHIQGKNHGNIQLHQLHGKIKVPLNICGIHNINNTSWMLIQYKIPCYDFFAGIRRHGINSRKICYQGIAFSTDRSVLSVHSNTWEISHMLAGAGKLIKQSCLSAVLVSCQCKGKHFTVRKGIFRFLKMKFSAFSQSRMRDGMAVVFL